MTHARRSMAYAPTLSWAANPWHLFGAFLLSALVLFLAANPAFAQAAGGSSGFSCTSGGGTSGTLYDSGGSCPTTLHFSNVFSFLVCNIEHLSSNLLGKMFCGMTHNLAPAVGAAVTLAAVLFGLGFTIGVIPATARDFQIFLLKMALISAFATQSDYLIRYGYEFFVNGIRDAVGVAFSSYQAGSTNSAPDVYKQLDEFLGQFIRAATDYVRYTEDQSSAADKCKNALFAVLAIMAIAFPPIFFLALILVIKVAITFVRAVFAYLYALVGITFLLTLAPIFLSFYLFRVTRSFFDKWVGYIVSFSLQIVLLFACLTFVLLMVDKAKTSSQSFVDIIVPVEDPVETTSLRMPWEYCTICDFKVVDATTNQVIPDDKVKDFIGKGKMVCKDSPGKAIPVLSTVAPQSGSAPNTTQQSTVLRFAGGGLIALMVLAFIAEQLVSSIPSLAQTVGSGFGGAYYTPQLGGGFTQRAAVDMPGAGLYGDFEAGLTRGFGQPNNSVGGIARGVKEGMAQMITGRSGSGQEIAGSGMKNRFLDWLVDPTHMDGH